MCRRSASHQDFTPTQLSKSVIPFFSPDQPCSEDTPRSPSQSRTSSIVSYSSPAQRTNICFSSRLRNSPKL
ncbi:hypothetical protein HZ326_7396 [Fusarium oxysporum f. sp. albedinis]|nr:hypothetical protein HZ326_7396 [Fusarium oxysporum f. sp. albedinis]